MCIVCQANIMMSCLLFVMSCSAFLVLCCVVCMQWKVKGEIKAMQTLAVVCSLLRHFAAVVVGVTRPQDEKYLADTVSAPP
jgi:hypothetical protein